MKARPEFAVMVELGSTQIKEKEEREREKKGNQQIIVIVTSH
jgi:hypothetical protein